MAMYHQVCGLLGAAHCAPCERCGAIHAPGGGAACAMGEGAASAHTAGTNLFSRGEQGSSGGASDASLPAGAERWVARAGAVGGADLYVHLLLPAVVALEAVAYAIAGGPAGFVLGLLLGITLFATVLIHELGHAGTCTRSRSALGARAVQARACACVRLLTLGSSRPRAAQLWRAASAGAVGESPFGPSAASPSATRTARATLRGSKSPSQGRRRTFRWPASCCCCSSPAVARACSCATSLAGTTSFATGWPAES